jgi:coenzyme F420-reducing hydrogenase beta subunit
MNSVFNSKNECYGCSSCVQVCPAQAISFEGDNEGFLYPEINTSKCCDCGLCRKSCPIYQAPSTLPSKEYPEAYAIWNKNDKIRSASTSGGVFTALATKIISDGGVVFGVAYDKAFKAVHVCIDSIDQLELISGSKYTQSLVGDSYIKVKEALNKNTKVLFSGTPCQISGLYSYLGKDYSNLVTCDCVCHGVPSPGIFELYKGHLQKLYNSEIETFSFRNKSKGWKSYHVGVTFKNGKQILTHFKQDPYMIGFVRNMFLRPSCHTCKYSSLNRQSDVTLADFWGVDKFYPELDDDKGTSLILINTPKGAQLLQSCGNELAIHECDLSYAVKDNPSLIEPSSPNKHRLKFFKHINNYDFATLQSKFLRPTSKTQHYIKRGNNFVRKCIKVTFRKLTS